MGSRKIGMYPKGYKSRENLGLYRCWVQMVTRCSEKCPEKKKKYYFEKGIRVCQEWMSWPNFCDWAKENGYSPRLTIDRIDGSKGYEPSNCRWATSKEQHYNRDLINTYRHVKETHTLIHAREFICLETGKRFLTKNEAGRQMGIHPARISECLLGKIKHVKGHHFAYC
jgi:hypothetical protein